MAKKRVLSIVLVVVFAFVAMPAYAISACGTLSVSDTLTQDISANGTCITIGANNVELDCQGYTIFYDGYGNSSSSSPHMGVSAISRDNVTIRNCVMQDINASGVDGHGIRIFNGNSGLIENNTIQANGTTNNFAVYFVSDAQQYVVRNNTLRADTSGSGAIGIRFAALGNHTAVDNYIRAFANAGATGIRTTQADNNVSFNTIIAIDNSSSPRGLYLSADRTFTRGNDITVDSVGSNGYGVFITGDQNKVLDSEIVVIGNQSGAVNIGIGISNSQDNIIRDTNVTVLGVTQSWGLHVTTSAINNTFDGMRVLTNGTSDDDGILMTQSSRYNNIFNTVFNVTGGGTSDAIRVIFTSHNNSFRNITFDQYDGFAVSFINVYDNFFDAINEPMSVTTSGFGIQSGSSQLLFTEPITGTLTNMSEHVSVNRTSVFVNSSALSALNASAEISVNNSVFIEPVLQVDFDDNGVFQACPPTLCTILAQDYTSMTYNVSHFTTFRIVSGTPPVPEFSTIALMGMLVLILGGFVVMRKQ